VMDDESGESMELKEEVPLALFAWCAGVCLLQLPASLSHL